MSSHDLGPEEDHGSVTGEPLDAATPLDDVSEAAGPNDVQSQPQRRRRVRRAVRGLFLPAQASPRWRRIAPWAALLVVLIGVGVGGTYAWTWGGSSGFCGLTCHTMPPQYASYQLAAHSRVTCAECHIGRGSFGTQLVRKAPHIQLVFRTIFHAYEYPIYAHSMRPAREACETCHVPAKFSDDTLRVKQHFTPDEENTPYSVSLVMKTGGGIQREGLGYGIHWHVENKVEFVSTDKLDQNIPYVRVTNSDGTVDEYVDVDSDFDRSQVDESSVKTMDCISCHNRVSHPFQSPVVSVESALARGVISSDIPYVRNIGVQVLSKEYPDREQALPAISQSVDDYYKKTYPVFYEAEAEKIEAAITELQRIYSVSVFTEQEIDWTTHPDNLGHIDSPGCFRCHDGKHLDAAKQAVRLECNVCHSIPVVTSKDQLVTNVEIAHGEEPASHRNANWISLHNQTYLYDESCANCHSMADDGGTSNTSFCSNSSCHGTVFKYAGFDAPGLRQSLQGQAPRRGDPKAPGGPSGPPTWESYIGPLLAGKCASCHDTSASAGLNLLSYSTAMQGGGDGPVIIPGDSAGSKLVTVQSSPHYANLSAEQLQSVEQWIDEGAAQE